MRAIEAERLLLREYGRLASLYNRYSVTSSPIVWKRVLETVPDLRGSRTLDLACGTGAHAVRLARAVGPGGQVIGIDAAQGMVEFARRRADARRQSNLKFLLMNSRRLRFPTGSFDLVVSTFGFALFGRSKCLREIQRVLKPAGVFVYVGWHGTNPEAKLFLEALAELRLRNPSPPDVQALTRARQFLGQLPANRSTLAFELRRAGFRRIRREVQPVSVRFRSPAAYVRYKATWGENDRELERLRPTERHQFVEEVARRMKWSRGAPRPEVTWELVLITAEKP